MDLRHKAARAAFDAFYAEGTPYTAIERDMFLQVADAVLALLDWYHVTTDQLTSAFVAAHDTSLASSNPSLLGHERAINNLTAIDAGVEAVRTRLITGIDTGR